MQIINLAIEELTEDCETLWFSREEENCVDFYVVDSEGTWELCTLRDFEDELFLEVGLNCVHLVGPMRNDLVSVLISNLVWEWE